MGERILPSKSESFRTNTQKMACLSRIIFYFVARPVPMNVLMRHLRQAGRFHADCHAYPGARAAATFSASL
jgi:hypothetical protein